MRKVSSPRKKRRGAKAESVTSTDADPAQQVIGFVARCKNSRFGRYVAATAILVTSLAGLISFASSLLDKTSGVIANLWVVRDKVVELYEFILQNPVDLRDEYVKHPNAFSRPGGVVFNRPVRLVGSLPLNNDAFSFTAPRLVTLRDDKTGDDPFIYRASSHLSLGVASSPAVSFSRNIFKASLSMARKVDASGYAGYFGSSPGVINVEVGALDGNLGIENNGQSGQAGGGGADGYEVIDSDDWSVVASVPPGPPGRGGDGGNGGNIFLKISKISSDSRIALISMAGSGGRSPDSTYRGVDGDAGKIEFNGVKGVGDLVCAFVAFEHDPSYLMGQMSQPALPASTQNRIASEFGGAIPSFTRSGIERGAFVLENKVFSIDDFQFWMFNKNDILVAPDIFDRDKSNGYCESGDYRKMKRSRYIFKPYRGGVNKG